MGVKRPRPAAVLIPLLPNGNSYDVLFEVRSAGIAQPGDICFPGGTMEPGETPEVAAVRETTEELLVSREQIRVLRTMNTRPGPKGRPVTGVLGILENYKGSFSRAEVDHVFTLPLGKLMAESPVSRTMPPRTFYYYPTPSEGAIWGITANLLHDFLQLLKEE